MISRRRAYLAAAFAGFAAGAALVIHAVFTSTNSTAAVGLILVPFFGAAGALLGAAALFSGFTFADVRAGRLPLAGVRPVAAASLVAAGLAFGAAWLTYRDAYAIAADPQSAPETLQAVHDRWLPLWRDEVLQALAKNPASPGPLLAELAAAADDGLLQLVGANPAAPLAVMEAIAARPRSYARDAGLAGNPRIPAAIAETLEKARLPDFRDDLEYKLYQTYVLGALARNPATPRAVFDRLAARDHPEYFLAIGIIHSPHASCAQIARAGEDGSEVLQSTAQGEMRRRGC